MPPDGYWQELRRICDKYGVLLCADEVICSFGRLGHFFGSERFGVVPDMITFAKGVTSAYLPLGGVVVRRPLLEHIWESEVGLFNHGSTFGGHPVATAVAVANIQAMHDEQIMQHVRSHEDTMRAGFESLVERHDIVREVRGTGYFYALELMASRERGLDLSEPDALALQQGVLLSMCKEAGLLIRPDDRGATMLVFSPPLIADEAVIADMHAKADQVLTRRRLACRRPLIEPWASSTTGTNGRLLRRAASCSPTTTRARGRRTAAQRWPGRTRRDRARPCVRGRCCAPRG